jgi:hypothetical protein
MTGNCLVNFYSGIGWIAKVLIFRIFAVKIETDEAMKEDRPQ